MNIFCINEYLTSLKWYEIWLNTKNYTFMFFMRYSIHGRHLFNSRSWSIWKRKSGKGENMHPWIRLYIQFNSHIIPNRTDLPDQFTIHEHIHNWSFNTKWGSKYCLNISLSRQRRYTSERNFIQCQIHMWVKLWRWTCGLIRVFCQLTFYTTGVIQNMY